MRRFCENYCDNYANRLAKKNCESGNNVQRVARKLPRKKADGAETRFLGYQFLVIRMLGINGNAQNWIAVA